MGKNVKISIVMLAYNHERFIAQALDSVLMQKTQYEYELIVGEDCSTDHTRDIIKEYKERFGGHLKPLFRESNLGASKNLLDCLEHCTGKYIAMLEGDDYWIDEKKLETQVSFMEANPEYVMCTHNWKIVDKDGRFLQNGRKMKAMQKYDIFNLAEFELPGQTATILCRNIYQEARKRYEKQIKKYYWIPFDRIVPLLVLQYGRIAVLPNIMSSYRYYIEAGGSNWSSRHEVEATQNRFYFYILALGMERFSKDIGIPLDCMNKKSQMLIENLRARHWKSWKYKWGYYLQAIGMVIVEPHRIRLVKTVKKMRTERYKG